TETFPTHTCQESERKLVPVNGYQAAEECPCNFEQRAKAFDQYEERTIRDIVSKLVKYGNISEKAAGFVSSLLGRIINRPIIAAQRQAEKDAAGPVPTGRVTMRGVVVGTKEVEQRTFGYSRYSSGYETVTKLIIKLENGSKVFGSR